MDNKMRYSTSIVYYHFKNKQEIIDAIIQSETKSLSEIIHNEIGEETDVVKNMTNVFRVITMLAVQEPEKFNLIVLNKYSEKKEAHPPWVDYLEQHLSQAMDEGKIRRMDAYLAAFSVWSSFLGFHILLSLQKDITPEQVEAMYLAQFDIIMNGILSLKDGGHSE